ncbi:MAG: KamA family protein [Bacteroidales bacterium]|nr:KamA family protein [Bacteroidales bacterium]
MLDEISLSSDSISFLFNLFIEENPEVAFILDDSENEENFTDQLKIYTLDKINESPDAINYYNNTSNDRETFENLGWIDVAAIRVLDYIDQTGRKFEDLNLRGKVLENRPFKPIFDLYQGRDAEVSEDYLLDMIMLFRQLEGELERESVYRERILGWMDRHPSGLESDIIDLHTKNRARILEVIISKIESKELLSSSYTFKEGMSQTEKMDLAESWWKESKFHMVFAIRTPDLLNEMLGFSLSLETLEIIAEARNEGIPFFVNPYYLSLLLVDAPEQYKYADKAIRDYVLYSKELVEEFGHIVAWEKEDIVKPGEPNAAGWILPTEYNLHRRYPEVAILIPDTVGRACGGLCVSCQRMYDFQSGNLNFDLEKLKPKQSWNCKLDKLMDYFENDSQLRDILITGGDALMSSNKSLKQILDAVYQMAIRKKESNKNREQGDKFAEMLRVRLGTRMPVYAPQRITYELIDILAEFKRNASIIGFKQFVIQTHFESPLEVTPEAKEGIRRLLSAGWTVSNQLVFTAAASRRGHTAKLRKVLNDIGVITYYTFNVKGFQENKNNFATNARAVQEQREEKLIGNIRPEYYERIKEFPLSAENMIENINRLREDSNIPFLGTDRNVLNLPGVGKSLTFRTIGITNDGRRILDFDHDHTRWHSPIIHKMGKVLIPEAKTMMEYLTQLQDMGEVAGEYESVFGYSIGETETRIPVYEYPKYKFDQTDQMTNLEI